MQSISYRKVHFFLPQTRSDSSKSHFLGFDDPSALLKHELAYCLGQMNRTSALPVLESVLRNQQEDPMVRHEVGLLFDISDAC